MMLQSVARQASARLWRSSPARSRSSLIAAGSQVAGVGGGRLGAREAWRLSHGRGYDGRVILRAVQRGLIRTIGA